MITRWAIGALVHILHVMYIVWLLVACSKGFSFSPVIARLWKDDRIDMNYSSYNGSGNIFWIGTNLIPTNWLEVNQQLKASRHKYDVELLAKSIRSSEWKKKIGYKTSDCLFFFSAHFGYFIQIPCWTTECQLEPPNSRHPFQTRKCSYFRHIILVFLLNKQINKFSLSE